MEFEQVRAIVGDIPITKPAWGKTLYDAVRENKPESILELGFLHGTSTCYLAAALAANGGGKILTIDRPVALTKDPDIYTLLERTGLTCFVEPIVSVSSYTWELKKLIERQTVDGACEPCFDFCFVDGAHTWETDGLAFFLVDKLLRPGGWVVFDDMQWTFSTSPGLKDSERVAAMPQDERSTPHIATIFDLLVRQHPAYGEFRVEGRWPWGWARKLA